MNRRDFLKLTAIVPFSGLLLSKPQPMPTELDKTIGELWEHADLATKEGPFVLHNGIWFFSDMEMVNWCAKDNLHWDGWDGSQIGTTYGCDYFDFWKKEEGKLYWYGKDTYWEIMTQPGNDLQHISFRFLGYIMDKQDE